MPEKYSNQYSTCIDVSKVALAGAVIVLAAQSGGTSASWIVSALSALYGTYVYATRETESNKSGDQVLALENDGEAEAETETAIVPQPVGFKAAAGHISNGQRGFIMYKQPEKSLTYLNIARHGFNALALACAGLALVSDTDVFIRACLAGVYAVAAEAAAVVMQMKAQFVLR